MVERDPLEGQLARLGEKIRPGQAFGGLGVVEVRQSYGRAQRRKGSLDGRDLVSAVDRLRAVPVAVDREHDRRLDLAPPVDHAARAELGRAGREDRAEARGREEQDEGLGDVRRVRHDTVAAAHAQPHQARTDTGDRVSQLRGRVRDVVTRLRPADDHHVVVGAARHPQHRLRVVQRDAREPGAPRHRGLALAHGDQCDVGSDPGRVTGDVEVLPDRQPERVDVLDRPGMEGADVIEDGAAVGPDPVHEVPDPRRTPGVRSGLPEDLVRDRRRGHGHTLNRAVSTVGSGFHDVEQRVGRVGQSKQPRDHRRVPLHVHAVERSGSEQTEQLSTGEPQRQVGREVAGGREVHEGRSAGRSPSRCG